MKKILVAFILSMVMSSIVFAQKDSARNTGPELKQYWFVLLTKGNNRSQDSATAMKIQMAHLDNIKRLYMEGKIKVAGPFGEEGDASTTDWQGIFIFDCPTREELEKLLKTDPAIAAGRLVYQIKQWYTVATGSFVPGKPAAPLF